MGSSARAIINGIWVDTLFPTADLKHSTVWKVDQPSGDYQASLAVGCPENFEDAWTLPGQAFRVYDQLGGLLFGGITSEPERTDEGVTVHARGISTTLDEFQAYENTAGPTDPPEYAPTFVPNIAVDEAEARGALFSRHGVDLGDDPIAVGDQKVVTVGELLSRAAIIQGKRVHVDSLGAVTFRTDPTTPEWTTTPDEGYMGTADEQFVTRLFGYFETSPPGFDVVYAEDTAAEDKFGGPRERTIDLTNLGAMTEAAAQAYVDGRFELVGGRMGWTEGVNLSHINLIHISGAWAPARYVRAGDMLQIPGVTDGRSNPTTRAAIRFVLSEVQISEALRPSAFAAPVGFTPRDFEGALAPPEKPAEKEAA